MAARFGTWLDRATRVALLSTLAIQSASPLLTLRGQDAMTAGDQSFPERLSGYGPRQSRVAVLSYEESQPASPLLTLRGQDALNPGKQPDPDTGALLKIRYARFGQYRAALSYEDSQSASPLLTLKGQDAMASASGRVADPDTGALLRHRAARAQQYRAAYSTEDGQSSLLATLLSVPAAIGPGAQLVPDRLPGTRAQQYRGALSSEDVQSSQLTTLLGAAPPTPFYGAGTFVWPDARLGYKRNPDTTEDVQRASLLLGLAGQDAVYAAPGQAPVYDWANPTRARRLPPDHALSLVGGTLQGQDQVYGAPGQAPVYDWLVPRGRPFPLSNRDQTTSLVTTALVGQDALYGAPGQAAGYDWPNPRLRRVQQPEIPPSLQGTLLFVTPPTPGPGAQLFPDRVPGYGPRQARLASGSSEDAQPASLLLTLAGQGSMASAAGRQPDPDAAAFLQVRAFRAQQYRAALSTTDVHSSPLGGAPAPFYGAGRFTWPDRSWSFRPQQPGQLPNLLVLQAALPVGRFTWPDRLLVQTRQQPRQTVRDEAFLASSGAHGATDVGETPISRWRLGEPDGAHYAYDDMGNNPGVYVGQIGYGVGVGHAPDSDTAVNFSPLGAYVTVPDTGAWDSVTDDFAIEASLLFATTTGTQVIMSHSDGAGNANKWIWCYDNGFLRLQKNTVAGPLTDAYAVAWTPEVGRWYHVVIDQIGTTRTAYVNGVGLGAQSSAVLLPGASGPLVIGQVDGGNNLAGRIDEVAFYGVFLGGGQVQAKYRVRFKPFPGSETTIGGALPDTALATQIRAASRTRAVQSSGETWGGRMHLGGISAAGTLVAGGRATLLAAGRAVLVAQDGAAILGPARSQTLIGPGHPTLETGE
jgi:hypothetical protein